MADFPTPLAVRTAEASLEAIAKLNASFEQALELIVYCDRRDHTPRKLAVLALALRNHLTDSRTTIAEVGLLVCQLHTAAIETLQEGLQPEMRTGSASGGTSGLESSQIP